MRSLLYIAMHKKLYFFKNESTKEILYEELLIARKINTKNVRKINTKKLNFLNRLLYFNPYIFYFIMRIYFRLNI